MNIKSIALALAGAVAVVASTAPVQASEYREGRIAGYQSFVLDSGSYGAPDYMYVYGPNGREFVTVVCAPFDWKSTGPNSAAWVDRIAREWCF